MVYFAASAQQQAAMAGDKPGDAVLWCLATVATGYCAVIIKFGNCGARTNHDTTASASEM